MENSRDPSGSSAIADLCLETLRRNWRDGVRQEDEVRFAYTRPSPGHYPFQWYWDSCFAAIVWRRFEPTRSRTELESLLAAQREDGFIGHTIFWDTPLNERQRLTYNVLKADAPMTASIQPPTLAWAWKISVGDPAALPAIGRQYDWLARNRDLDGDGLIWIVQPDESGLDASPQFDAIWHGHADGLPGFVRLVRRNRKHGYDLRRIDRDGGPVCCEVMTNVIHALALLALGRPSLTPAIVERLYDEQAGLFGPIARPQPALPPAVTWAALSPLALPDLPEAIGRRLVEEHLLDPSGSGCRGPAVGARQPPGVLPAGIDPRDQALLARTDVDQRLLAGVAGAGPSRLSRAGRRASSRPRWRGRGRGTPRVLRPLHGPWNGGHGLRLVVADRRDARPDPRAAASFLDNH